MFAWPAFALLLSRAWGACPDRREVKLALALPLVLLVALGGLGLAVYGLGGTAPGGGEETSAPFGARNSVLGAISGIAESEWRRLLPLLLLSAGGLLVGGSVALALLRRPETRAWSWAPVAAGMLGMLVAAVAGLQVFAPLFGLKPIAMALRGEAARGALVIYDGPSHRASSLCFYADVPLRWLELPETEFAVRSRGVGRDRFVAEDEVVERWRAGGPVWLITEESRVEFWRARFGGDSLALVARSGTRVLMGNLAARGTLRATGGSGSPDARM